MDLLMNDVRMNVESSGKGYGWIHTLHHMLNRSSGSKF